MAITKEHVYAAADELLSKGVKPTLQSVRAALGAGSFTTISLAMAEWRAVQAAGVKNKEPLPEDVAAALLELGGSLWDKARKTAEERLAAERQRLEDATETANAERNEAVQLADSLTAEVERRTQEQQGVQKQLDRATNALNTHKERIAALEARVAEQELRVQERLCEIERLTAQNVELSRALTRALAGAPSAAGAEESGAGSSSSSA